MPHPAPHVADLLEEIRRQLSVSSAVGSLSKQVDEVSILSDPLPLLSPTAPASPFRYQPFDIKSLTATTRLSLTGPTRSLRDHRAPPPPFLVYWTPLTVACWTSPPLQSPPASPSDLEPDSFDWAIRHPPAPVSPTPHRVNTLPEPLLRGICVFFRLVLGLLRPLRSATLPVRPFQYLVSAGIVALALFTTFSDVTSTLSHDSPASPIYAHVDSVANRHGFDRLSTLSRAFLHLPFRPPVDRSTLSSDFGLRMNPVGPGQDYHAGVDLAAPQGTLVSPPGFGVVEKVDYNSGRGNYVRVDHSPLPYSSVIGHLDTVVVHAGTSVDTATTIGTVGSTGQSTGSHVHFEVRSEGHPVDPADLFDSTSNVRSAVLDLAPKVDSILVELWRSGPPRSLSRRTPRAHTRFLSVVQSYRDSLAGLVRPVLQSRGASQ